jgi:cytoskeletal protein RodZ
LATADQATRYKLDRAPGRRWNFDPQFDCLTLPRDTAYSAVEGIFSLCAGKNTLRACRRTGEDQSRVMATGTFGERLKRERELREVSLKEVTAGTRIGPRFLEALENEEWEKLPGGVFNRGFVRAIARYLGLDEENLLAEYDMARGGEQSMPAPQPYENKLPRPPIWIPLLAVLALLAIVGGLVAGGVYGWRWYAARRAAKKSSSSALLPQQTQHGLATVVPAAATDQPSDAGTSPPVVPLDLTVSTSAATRVRILADGALLLDAELPAGEARHFSASQQFEVTAADSSAVLLELNGRAMPPVGTPGASGTIVLSQKDLRQAPGGTPQP